MTHERTLELLDDFVDGALEPGADRDVRRHLMQCEGCREEERVLRTLLENAAALPEEILPERDLWAGIAPRLQARDGAAPAGESGAGMEVLTPRRPRRLPWWVLAAASVALVVASSLATLQLAPRPGSVAELSPERAAPPPSATPATAFAAFRPAEREYERAIGDLTAVLETRRDQLAPETVAVIEENLRVIDQAIAESRAALSADPASQELTHILADAYDAKLGVLRQVVQL
jgi:hypothetical protein